MSGVCRSFLTGLVDYAGLFPPAALGMADAVAHYARHRTEAAGWMLGRFIVPAGRLAEMLAAGAPGFSAASPWELSVLVGGRDGIDATEAVLPEQAAAVATAESDAAGGVSVAAVECVLPVPPDAGRLLGALAAAGLAGREIHCELPPAADVTELLTDLAAAARQAGPSGSCGRIGAKLRCGGVTADAFPTCERVAAVIAACRDLRLPLKCTAGLHHPVRHRASEPEVMMHGFLNVLGAGLLAHARGAGLDELTACVAETDPAAFGLDAAGFSWRDSHVPAVIVADLRADLLGGFGSCSFDEPRDDLTALGLL